jgi:hypothetical protein
MNSNAARHALTPRRTHRPGQLDSRRGPSASERDLESGAEPIPVDDEECDEIGPDGGFGGTGPDQGDPER